MYCHYSIPSGILVLVYLDTTCTYAHGVSITKHGVQGAIPGGHYGAHYGLKELISSIPRGFGHLENRPEVKDSAD